MGFPPSPASGGSTDGWTASSDTWTYASATTFTISGVDRTAVFTKGTRIRLTQTTTKYLVVIASSFSTNTTVTVTGGSDYSLANAAIVSPSYSYQANPQGYPGWFNFAPSVTGYSGSPTVNTAQFFVVGNCCTTNLDVTGTSNATTAGFTHPISTVNTNNDLLLVGGLDNGASIGPGNAYLSGPGTVWAIFKSVVGGAWTASGTKSFRIYGQFLF